MNKDLEKKLFDYLTTDPAIEYFIYNDATQGRRVFKWNHNEKMVVQAVVRPPLEKKGRGHVYGVFQIKESSFRSQWYWKFNTTLNDQLRHTTQKLFEYHANKVFSNMLKE